MTLKIVNEGKEVPQSILKEQDCLKHNNNNKNQKQNITYFIVKNIGR